MPTRTFRIALLHLAPVPGDLIHNRRLIESSVTMAARLGASWIVTPELVIPGYSFAELIGTEWILTQPDAWMTALCRMVRQLGVTVFLSHPEKDRESSALHNSLFVITADGRIVGRHRKINTLRVGAESWSSPGDCAIPLAVPPFAGVGLMICADAYSTGIARSLCAQGVMLLVSAAAWAPGLHGPDGEWERCTEATGLPLFVCNRTGIDGALNFTRAETVIVKDGKRLLSYSSERSSIVLIDWDLDTQDLATATYQSVRL